MKKYYQTLNKEQKNKIKEAYKKEYANTDLQIRLTRLVIYAVIGYLSGIIILIEAFMIEENKLGSMIIASTLLVLSTTFLIGRSLVKVKVLNKIALKNK